jgi:hypothetical protein
VLPAIASIFREAIARADGACGTEFRPPDGHGLRGQHVQYPMKQLPSFQNNMRNLAVMHGGKR